LSSGRATLSRPMYRFGKHVRKVKRGRRKRLLASRT
jgi:hypothetical protein